MRKSITGSARLANNNSNAKKTLGNCSSSGLSRTYSLREKRTSFANSDNSSFNRANNVVRRSANVTDGLGSSKHESISERCERSDSLFDQENINDENDQVRKNNNCNSETALINSFRSTTNGTNFSYSSSSSFVSILETLDNSLLLIIILEISKKEKNKKLIKKIINNHRDLL